MMSYKVLYRKYRPDSFEKIIGQETIVTTLKESVGKSTFSHAYIFTGPRGTGKTSTAKVLAKAINCLNPINGEACGKCDNCINFATSPDIIEIDAASNNGVDEIRELRNNINLAPAAAKYKIYIIDEVHMLSSGAFNALLKTLEEPPAHAIFILATTEIYKVPITILSRCQRYDFKKVNRQEMVEHLKYVCEQEKIKYDLEACNEIYDLSEGCVRDALSILDQSSKTTSELKLSDLIKNFNIISKDTIFDILDSIKAGEIEHIVSVITEFEDTGMNPQKLIKKMIMFLEQIAIDIKLAKEKRYDFNAINKIIKDLNQCYIDARVNENTFTMIKLAFLEQVQSTSSFKNNEKTKDKITELNDEPKNILSEEVKDVSSLTLAEIRVNNCFVEAKKEDLNNLVETWEKIDKKKISGIVKQDYTPVASSSKYAVFTAEESSLVDLFNIKREDIEKILKKQKLQLKIIAVTAEDWIKIKEKYKNNIKQKIKYNYIDEPEDEDSLEVTGKIEDLFTDQVVEVS